jgi:hypothetical protein
MVATGTHIQCSAQAPGAFETNLQAAPLHSDSIVVHQGAQLVSASPVKKNSNPVPSTPHSQIRRRRPADMFAKSSPLLAPKAQGQELICNPATSFGSPLISIGSNTDAMLDRLKLGDEILPELRALVRTVRSSRWEAVFMSPKWNLARGQAAMLSNALLADLQVGMVPFSPDAIILKVSYVPFFSSLIEIYLLCSADRQYLPPSSSCLAF